MCPHLNESEGMHISYTDNFNEGSIASFHCVFPRERTGISRTTCRNGEWVDPMPTCTLLSCSLDSLFRIVPENVVPVMDNVTSDTLPFNYTLQLTCDGGLRISGIETATCGSEGWQISRVQCVAGCPNPLKTKDPELLVEPHKDFYRFGESVTLACNPGYVLSSEVVRLMCLGSTWSETQLPHCQEE
ncbi:hypothetical protein CDAR_303581 [Caerostris darwini]|nr:hypothetical protein CDAR_303581 [Caerostris darwini]